MCWRQRLPLMPLASSLPLSIVARQHASHAAPRPTPGGDSGAGNRAVARASGLILALALHAAAFWGLWNPHLIPLPQEAKILFVNFIAPSNPPVAPRVEPVPRRKPPQPRLEEKPQPRPLVAAAVPGSPAEAIAPPPLPTPALAVSAEPRPTGPVRLDAELSVSCPERSVPDYPLLSRRMGETGTTLLRVELDEQGEVAAARIATGSGSARLDEAALAAVKTWRCKPAQRAGQPVRAVALQAFKFVLQGN